MYIEKPRGEIRESKRQDLRPRRLPSHFQSNLSSKKEARIMIKAPEQRLLSQYSKDVILHWQAPEFEIYEKDRKWYFWISAFLTAIVAWAVYSNSPIMAITFILIGVVGYMYLQKDPRLLDFMITPEGITAGREIYEFDNIHSFWVFYEPEGEKMISLKTGSHLAPIVRIPIENEDPAEIRRILLEFIPEEKQDPGIWQIMERLLRI